MKEVSEFTGTLAPPKRASNQIIPSTTDDEEDEDDDKPLRDIRPLRQPMQDSSSIASREEAKPRKYSKPSPKKPSSSSKKSYKKPSYKKPVPISMKPVAKNDIRAKLETIRQIESYWGKSFIVNFIPKCHRPLSKRKGGTKRSIYRTHESDPREWLPSVLKAVLMVASQTSDKASIKNAMNEVVRYRIKHTGNRKPQLVTTDFDVIEDMVIRGWSCKASFEIRYKHLLMMQTRDNLVSNQEIDNIMWADSEDETLENLDRDDEDDEDQEDFSTFQFKVEDDSDAEDVHNDAKFPPNSYDDGISQRSNSYFNTAPHYPPLKKSKPPMSSKQTKQSNMAKPSKPSKQSNLNESMLHPHPHYQHQQMYGYGAPMRGHGGGHMGYGAPPHGYGYPPHSKGYHPPNQYAQYGGYPPYGYGPPNPGMDPRAHHPGMSPYSQPNPSNDPRARHQRMSGYSPSNPGKDPRARHQSRSPYSPGVAPPPSHEDSSTHFDNIHGKSRQSERFSPFGQARRNNADDTPIRGAARPSIEATSSRKPFVKREPGLDNAGVEHDPILLDDDYEYEGPTNYFGSTASAPIPVDDDKYGGMDDIEDDDDQEEMDLRAAEAEALALRLRAKMNKKGQQNAGRRYVVPAL
jgi:hypothetical protein